jgi:hypothetical protein
MSLKSFKTAFWLTAQIRGWHLILAASTDLSFNLTVEIILATFDLANAAVFDL